MFKHFAQRATLLLCGLWCFWGLTPVWGQTPEGACPEAFPLKPPQSSAARQQELTRLEGLSEACSTRADFYAWQGALWLSEGAFQQAAIALEKALLLNPDLPGVELDYAQVLAQMGEKSSARDLVGSVLARPDIPIPLRDWLTSAQMDWAEPSWQRRLLLQTMVGAESNLNSAPTSGILTLTLPGGSVPVVLAQNEHPRGGWASLNTAAAEATHTVGEGTLSLAGEASARLTPGDTSNNLETVSASALWVRPVMSSTVGARLGVTRLWLGGIDLYEENAIKVFAEHAVPGTGNACRGGLGLDYALRVYPSSSTLNGDYSGAQLGVGCQREKTSISGIAQWGRDRAQDPVRLGGGQDRVDFTLSGSQNLATGVASLVFQWSRLHDADSYSPLLGRVARVITRQAGRAQYEYFINKRLSMIGYLEKTSQQSNISLFEMANQAFYLGLRWSLK